MNLEHKARKQAIRNFMQTHYTDARLAELYAHAKDGKLQYMACCCFIGIPTADHALTSGMDYVDHYNQAMSLSGADEAEDAFLFLYKSATSVYRFAEDARRRILIPMVRAEMKRRSYARAKKAFSEQFARDLEAVFA